MPQPQADQEHSGNRVDISHCSLVTGESRWAWFIVYSTFVFSFIQSTAGYSVFSIVTADNH